MFGENGAFRLVSSQEAAGSIENPDDGLFSPKDDYNVLLNAANSFPQILEEPVKSVEHFKQLIEKTDQEEFTIPLFIKDKTGELHIISSDNKDQEHVTESSVRILALLHIFDTSIDRFVRNVKSRIAGRSKRHHFTYSDRNIGIGRLRLVCRSFSYFV